MSKKTLMYIMLGINILLLLAISYLKFSGEVARKIEISGEFSGRSKKENLAEALKQVGLDEEFLKHKIYALSGGEQQRVALARLYLKDSSIILADEPTGSLDAANREKVLSILADLNKQGKTVIIVTHDPEVEKKAGRVIRL